MTKPSFNLPGPLAAPVDFATAEEAHRVVAADFDGDGLLDLATAKFDFGMTVLLADGPASFAAPVFYDLPIFFFAFGLDAADVDGDGALDVCVASGLGSEMAVFFGNGSGGFTPGPFVPIGGRSIDLRFADINADGAPDVVVTNFTEVNAVSILLGTCPRYALACAVDDASGDTWSIVTDPAAPTYRQWRYRVAATGQVLGGTASRFAFIPNRSLTAADTDDAKFYMTASFNYAANTGTVRVLDRATGRQFTIRDRNLRNNPPCQ
jgi:hypothetical protein